MNLFETVKSAVTVKQAAEYYGCKVNRGDMICCPFHDDRHPSMKLNRDYFYCFGCGATGDVIDFVARLFGLSSYVAAKKLAYDFGIDPDKPPTKMALTKPYTLAQAIRSGGDFDLICEVPDAALLRQSLLPVPRPALSRSFCRRRGERFQGGRVPFSVCLPP